jgi:hypothetical protein
MGLSRAISEPPAALIAFYDAFKPNIELTYGADYGRRLRDYGDTYIISYFKVSRAYHPSLAQSARLGVREFVKSVNMHVSP